MPATTLVIDHTGITRPGARPRRDVAEPARRHSPLAQQSPARVRAARPRGRIQGQDRPGPGAVKDRMHGHGVRPVQHPGQGAVPAEQDVERMPGGIGGVEAVLAAGLTAIGIPAHEAIPAVLLFRVATFWLPIPAGWIA